jgi:hypothetical protein
VTEEKIVKSLVQNFRILKYNHKSKPKVFFKSNITIKTQPIKLKNACGQTPIWVFSLCP